MGKIANEYVSLFTAEQNYIAEILKAWRKRVHIKRARQQARLRSIQHHGKKVYVVYDSDGSLRVLFREEIIVLKSRGLYTGRIDHISLNRDAVAWEQVDPHQFMLKRKWWKKNQ